jgi:hypothetical protein
MPWTTAAVIYSKASPPHGYGKDELYDLLMWEVQLFHG